MLPLTISAHEDGVTFQVRVSPRAKKNGVLGAHDGALKVSLTAAPVDGAANAALIAYLAKSLSVARSAVQIQSGETARCKRVRVLGITAARVMELLR